MKILKMLFTAVSMALFGAAAFCGYVGFRLAWIMPGHLTGREWTYWVEASSDTITDAVLLTFFGAILFWLTWLERSPTQPDAPRSQPR